MILPSADVVSLPLAVASALAYLATALAGQRLPASTLRHLAQVAWLMHGITLGLALLAPSPRFGFAPALSMTVWLAAGVYAIESHLVPQLQTRWALAWLGAMAVLLALVFPGNQLHAKASIWLPLHWAFGIASYGLFGVAVVHAWLMTRAENRIRMAAEPDSGMPLMMLERLTFRFVGVGFVLLTATLGVALLFAEQLYGASGQSGIRWDHKTIFSVLSWVAFLILLVGRARYGWRGRTAVRVLYAGAGLLLLAYVGSRFVLEVILGRTT
jgi:ABC-type uncharacterized transport system permease subunit